jgi:hypothetical protein
VVWRAGWPLLPAGDGVHRLAALIAQGAWRPRGIGGHEAATAVQRVATVGPAEDGASGPAPGQGAMVVGLLSGMLIVPMLT